MKIPKKNSEEFVWITQEMAIEVGLYDPNRRLVACPKELSDRLMKQKIKVEVQDL